MGEKPIDIPPSQIEYLYNFSNSRDQVNWSARHRPNLPFLTQLLPHLYDFLDYNIRRISYDPSSLRATIGISGGLDSSVVTYLTAETMRRAQQLGTSRDTNLMLLTFKGMSEEDYLSSLRFAEDVKTAFPDIPITHHTRDLTEHLRHFDQFTDQILQDCQRPKIYSGELASRLYTSILLECADKSGHAALDCTNGTEYILGEIVIGGGAECAPLVDFYKSQVYDLAEILGLPDYIINRPPINSAWGHNKVATYFQEIPPGLTPRDVFSVLDPILYLLFERRLSPQSASASLGHSFEVTNSIAQRLASQTHRRDIPFFTVHDRYKKYPRNTPTIDNQTMRQLFSQSFDLTT